MTDKMDFRISVLIPYYQADEFFDECIQSVLHQTYRPEEIIVVNDNSGDTSKKYLKRYENDVKIIHLNASHGVAGARNVALSATSCEWVAFQDADDIWAIEKLQKQVDILKLEKEWIGCHTGVTTFDETGDLNTYISKPSPVNVEDLLMGSHVTPPSLLIKKSVLDELNNFDTTFKTSSDYDFSIRVAKAGYKIGFVPLSLLRVRRSNHGNISSNGFRTFKSHLKLVRKHRDVFFGVSGFNNTRRFLAKSLRESGGKIGGIRGRMIFLVGRLLGL